MLIANLRNLIADESGATAIEYGLIAALVSVAAIGALTSMGGSLSDMFGTVSLKLACAVNPAGAGCAAP
jgi:pilus assembly protein Flp/PilA